MCFLYWYLPQESLKKHSEILGFSVVFGLDHRWTQWGDVTHLDGAGLPPGEVSPSENEVHGWVLVNLWTWYKLLPKLSSWIFRWDRARKLLGCFCSHSPRFSRPGAVQNTRTLPHLQKGPHIGNPSQQLKVSCLNSVCACFSHSAFVIHRETLKGTSHHPLETRRCCQKRSTHTHKSCKVTTCKAWRAHCCYGGGALVRKKLPRGGSQYSRSYRIWKQIHVNSFDQE